MNSLSKLTHVSDLDTKRNWDILLGILVSAQFECAGFQARSFKMPSHSMMK
jgi:hypothetical protein